MPTPVVTISPSGNAALRVTSALQDGEAGWRLVHHLARFLETARVPGVTCVIPTYDAALIEVDPLEVSLEHLHEYLEHLIDGLDYDYPLTATPREFDVPVWYDFDGELDLLSVAESQGLSPEEIVQMHSAQRYVVRCLGAPGGSPMLDGPPFPYPVARLASPRVHVPQGVVSVAGRQATITPAPAPGGWPLIGRTPLTVLSLDAEPFVPYEPGDIIRFHSIDRREYESQLGALMVSR